MDATKFTSDNYGSNKIWKTDWGISSLIRSPLRTSNNTILQTILECQTVT